MAEEYVISIFGERRRVKGPDMTEEERKELERYLEDVFVDTCGPGPAKVVASTVLEDRHLFSLILKIAWEYFKLKKRLIEIEAELNAKLEEALRLAEFIRERGGS